jgi:hypothetical protein
MSGSVVTLAPRTVPALMPPPTVNRLILRATEGAHTSLVGVITGKEVTTMRRLIALALLIGVAFSAVTPASATINCPKYEGYPDCHPNW